MSLVEQWRKAVIDYETFLGFDEWLERKRAAEFRETVADLRLSQMNERMHRSV